MAEGREEGIPRDAKIVKTLLKSMNVDDYEPQVVHQFLELWYRYVADVLTDAQVYSEHYGKSTIDSDDVKLAIQSKVNFSFSQPPPRQRNRGQRATVTLHHQRRLHLIVQFAWAHWLRRRPPNVVTFFAKHASKLPYLLRADVIPVGGKSL